MSETISAGLYKLLDDYGLSKPSKVQERLLKLESSGIDDFKRSLQALYRARAHEYSHLLKIDPGEFQTAALRVVHHSSFIKISSLFSTDLVIDDPMWRIPYLEWARKGNVPFVLPHLINAFLELRPAVTEGFVKVIPFDLFLQQRSSLADRLIEESRQVVQQAFQNEDFVKKLLEDVRYREYRRTTSDAEGKRSQAHHLIQFAYRDTLVFEFERRGDSSPSYSVVPCIEITDVPMRPLTYERYRRNEELGALLTIAMADYCADLLLDSFLIERVLGRTPIAAHPDDRSVVELLGKSLRASSDNHPIEEDLTVNAIEALSLTIPSLGGLRYSDIAKLRDKHHNRLIVFWSAIRELSQEIATEGRSASVAEVVARIRPQLAEIRLQASSLRRELLRDVSVNLVGATGTAVLALWTFSVGEPLTSLAAGLLGGTAIRYLTEFAKDIRKFASASERVRNSPFGLSLVLGKGKRKGEKSVTSSGMPKEVASVTITIPPRYLGNGLRLVDVTPINRAPLLLEEVHKRPVFSFRILERGE